MPAAEPKQTLVRVLRPDGVPEGAGFLMADGRVMTCAHVVEIARNDAGDVLMDFPLLADRALFESRVVALYPVSETPSPGIPEDICVLEPRDPSRLPASAGAAPLRFLRGRALRKRPVWMCGFPEGMDDGDNVEGKLMGETGSGRVQLDHALTSRAVAQGFSGAPVWDDKTDAVLGMIVAVQSRDQKTSAYMIPAETLAAAWPGLRPVRGRAGDIVPLLCDRDMEDFALGAFFNEHLMECPNRPHLYVVAGCRGACHGSLIARFGGTHVKNRIDLNPKPYTVKWPIDGPFEMRRAMLIHRLFDAVFKCTDGACETPKRFAEMCCAAALADQGVVMLVHDVHLPGWDRNAGRLLEWYATAFWSAMECGESLPRFLIFLNLVYPSAALFWHRWRIGRFLDRLRVLLHDGCPCMIIKNLPGVEREHLHAWFTPFHDVLSEKERLDWEDKIFNGRRRVRMADVEDHLRAIHQEINRRLSGLIHDIPKP